MNYFRHAPLSLWVAVTVALGSLLVAGALLGGSSQAEVNVPQRVAATDNRIAAKAAMERVSGVYPAVRSGERAEWSQETREHFIGEFEKFTAAGGDPESPLGLAWQSAITAAKDLETAKEEEVLTVAAVLGQRVHELVSVAHGISSGGAHFEATAPETQNDEAKNISGAVEIRVLPSNNPGRSSP